MAPLKRPSGARKIMRVASLSAAQKIVARCRELARISDVPGETTRLFLSPATRDAHTLVEWWMRQAGCSTKVDDAGNLRGLRAAAQPSAPRLVLLSHLDTVPNAGAFDGPLGIVLAIEALASMGDEPLPIEVEILAFSEEEGVRFGFPFLGSLAVTGRLREEDLARVDREGVSVADALRAFGLQPEKIAESCPLNPRTFAALEVHIEQGPVLEKEDRALAVVEAIAGQSRFELTFIGEANHAGTTPMPLRRDALVAAAHWIGEVERYAASYRQLVATVGSVQVVPNAANVIPGEVRVTLDVRHPKDESRHAAVANLLTRAEHAADLHGVAVKAACRSEQSSVPMDRTLSVQLQHAAEAAGQTPHAMFSGAGHDAMIVAQGVPTAMLFVRSPGGLSHHPAEDVRVEDVEAALQTVVQFLRSLRPAVMP